MDPLTLALIGGGVGLAKSEIFDRPQAQRDRRMAAETMRYSPWTGMQPEKVKEADPLGNVMQGAMTGGMMGQNMTMVDNQNALMKAQTDALNRGGYSPWMGMPYSPNPTGPQYA